jgi:hypothetical protein
MESNSYLKFFLIYWFFLDMPDTVFRSTLTSHDRLIGSEPHLKFCSFTEPIQWWLYITFWLPMCCARVQKIAETQCVQFRFMLLHAHVAAMRMSLAHSVFLGAFQEALVKAVEDLKKCCNNCVYVWNKYVHGNLTFYIRNQTDLTECVWKNYVQNYAL